MITFLALALGVGLLWAAALIRPSPPPLVAEEVRVEEPVRVAEGGDAPSLPAEPAEALPTAEEVVVQEQPAEEPPPPPTPTSAPPPVTGPPAWVREPAPGGRGPCACTITTGRDMSAATWRKQVHALHRRIALAHLDPKGPTPRV